MSDKFNLDAFLAEVEFADDAEKEVVTKFFGREKNQAKVLTQSDYSKKLDGLSAKEQQVVKLSGELAAKQQSLDTLITQNIEYKGVADKEIEKANKEIVKLRAKAIKAATEAGYTLDEIEDDEVIVPRKPAFNEEEFIGKLSTKYVSPEMLDRLATGHINLTLELDEIKDTYAELYPNKRLTKTQKEELLQEYNADVAKHMKAHPHSSPPPLMDTATRLYDFGAVRGELETKRVEKLLADARADERAKLTKEMSDQGLPAPRRGGPISPIAFKSLKEGEKPSDDRRIRLAMEALQQKRAAAG